MILQIMWTTIFLHSVLSGPICVPLQRSAGGVPEWQHSRPRLKVQREAQ